LKQTIAIAGLVLAAACASSSSAPSSSPVGLRIEDLGPDLQLLRIDDEVWIHVSDDKTDRWGSVPANGMLVGGGNETLLVDTGWKESQTKRIVDFAQRTLNGPVRRVVATHAHSDRIGGLGAFAKTGIVVYAQEMTADAIEKLDLGVKVERFREELTIHLGPRTVELYYPGPGHSRDNSVVWLPGENILFAGCIVKSARSADLGNREDAFLASWPISILHLLERYGRGKEETLPEATAIFRHADLVIPGHGPPGRIELLHHTLGLLEQEMSSATHNGHSKHN
jgi:metallo-beta-lactamase class B